MPERLVVNASPLIFPARVEGLAWLHQLSPAPLLIPRAVLEEVRAGGEDLATRVEAAAWSELVDDVGVPTPVAGWDLGRGETQVIAVSWATRAATAVLDDGHARKAARSLGIPIVGTLGVILAARKKGWIAAARPVLEGLTAQGMRLAPALLEAALARVGE